MSSVLARLQGIYRLHKHEENGNTDNAARLLVGDLHLDPYNATLCPQVRSHVDMGRLSWGVGPALSAGIMLIAVM